MAYVYIYQYLHILFFIGILSSVFFTDYKDIHYLFFILLVLFVTWVIHGCFLKDYEIFIEWKYDKNEDLYPIVVKDTENTFHDDKVTKKKFKVYKNTDVSRWIPSLDDKIIRDKIWWSALFIFMGICVYKYYFKYNLITSSIPLNYTIIILVLYYVLLIIPAIHHYYLTKYYKLLSIYLVTFSLLIYLITHYNRLL